MNTNYPKRVKRSEQPEPIAVGWYYGLLRPPRSTMNGPVYPIRVWMAFNSDKLYVFDGSMSKLSDYKWFGPVPTCVEVL